MSTKPTFASLYSGCGGFDLGFLSEGWESIGAFDNDRVAVENYRANVSELVDETDLTCGIPDVHALRKVDALIAGPPCQGFSVAGKRILDDERNHLLPLTGQLAKKIKPRILIVENVPGALAGEHKQYFTDLETSMRVAGYRTYTMNVQVARLGMAQLRRRILFFAWKTGHDVQFPEPTLTPGVLRQAIKGSSRYSNHAPRTLEIGSRDFLIAQRISPGQKLCNVRGGTNSVPTWDIPEAFGSVTQHERTVLELVRLLRRKERVRDFGDADPVSLLRLEAALGSPFHELLESLITKGYLRRITNGVDLVGTFNGKYRRLSWDRPSYTVDTRFGSPRYFLHPTKHRGFTVREAARIQGFPDTYRFRGGEAAQFRLIGNAVPPPLAVFAAGIGKRLLGISG